ncbi:hypothetical protein AURDEDRAFT_178394, partial [Auricularia subglabra TFB-10046 SS5]
LYAALPDHLARMSLAATSSSSRVSATVLVASGEALPGPGRPSRSHVPRRDIQLLALVRDGTGIVGRCFTRRCLSLDAPAVVRRSTVTPRPTDTQILSDHEF